MLLAEKLDLLVEPSLHLVEHRSRNENAAGRAQSLQPCRYIDALAINVVSFHEDIAEIDPDVEFEALVFDQFGIERSKSPLGFYGAVDRIHHTGEFGQEPVAHEFHDTSVVLANFRLDQRLTVRLETCKRACLVDLHKAAVADHICRKNGREPALVSLQGRTSRYASIVASSTERAKVSD